MNTHDQPDVILDSKSQQKKCQFCGRFFRPDSRVGKRQIACSREICRKLRKQKAQRTWLAGNPDYFKGRSLETKAWRLNNPDYQRTWRQRRRREIQDKMSCNSSIITMHLAIMDASLKVEIQDEIRRQNALGRGFVVAGRLREMQDKIDPQTQ